MNSIWKEIKNFKQLQDCMVEYLNGEYTRNPWCCAGIDSETVPMIHSLVEINRSGFVTVVSQPGVNTIWADLSEEYQRGFMTGFILKDRCDMFIESLLRVGKVVICKQELDSGQPPKLYGDYDRLSMTRGPLERESDCEVVRGTGRFINLTKEVIREGDPFLNRLDEYDRSRLVKENGKYVRYYTNKWLDYGCDETDVLTGVNNDLQKYLRDNTYQLTVIRSDYGSVDLDGIILEVLLKIRQE
jgi:hypothetical protein